MIDRFRTDTLTGVIRPELPEFEHPPADPIELFGHWFDFAVENEVIEPGAFALATVDGQGVPSTRTLLMKDWDERGLLFVTSTGPVKAPGLLAGRPAAATFYWRETVQQVQLRGVIEPATREESDGLFAERPRAAQAAAATSHQSEVLEDESALRDAVSALLPGEQPIARPGYWSGFRLVPAWIEFWQGAPERIHRRLAYERSAAGWVHRRLQP